MAVVRDYEADSSFVQELKTGQEAVQWQIAELMAYWVDQGRTPKQLAADWGFAASTVRQYVRTWRAFPLPADRVPLLSFRHHTLAARTTDPSRWIAEAEAHAWSTRDLEATLRAARAADPAEHRRTVGERLCQRLDRWLEAAEPAEAAEVMERLHALLARWRPKVRKEALA